MIAQLTGRIAYKAPDSIILDVNGVGYRVQIPFSTYFAIPDIGAELSLQIYTHVKEDAINLYGFVTLQEKLFFQLLISVSGIGPKLARDILSNIQPDELSLALVNADLGRLSSIPGIGKKTAERLVLELKDKVVKSGLSSGYLSKSHVALATADLLKDIASALINLGYKEALVTKTLAEMAIDADAQMESTLKLALKRLMK